MSVDVTSALPTATTSRSGCETVHMIAIVPSTPDENRMRHRMRSRSLVSANSYHEESEVGEFASCLRFSDAYFFDTLNRTKRWANGFECLGLGIEIPAPHHPAELTG